MQNADRKIVEEIFALRPMSEEIHFSQMEKRANSKWFALAKTELEKISAQQK